MIFLLALCVPDPLAFFWETTLFTLLPMSGPCTCCSLDTYLLFISSSLHHHHHHHCYCHHSNHYFYWNTHMHTHTETHPLSNSVHLYSKRNISDIFHMPSKKRSLLQNLLALHSPYHYFSFTCTFGSFR